MSTTQLPTVTKDSKEQDNRSSWLNWCRLCAKQDDAGQTVFSKTNAGQIDSLATSIGKYFWVNIKAEDEISKSICKECHKLVGELITFTERVNKVQTLYCLLENLKPSSLAEANKLRSQCLKEDWEHIIKEEFTRPPLVSQEVQTDLVIFFNSASARCKKPSESKGNDQQNDKQRVENDEDEVVMDTEQGPEQTFEYLVQDSNYKGTLEGRQVSTVGNQGQSSNKRVLGKLAENDEEDIMLDIEQEPEQTFEYVVQASKYKEINKSKEGKLNFENNKFLRSGVSRRQIVKQSEQGPVQTFEYLVQNEDDLIEVERQDREYIEGKIKFKLHTGRTEPEDEAEIEDSELFKDLKFKMEKNDENIKCETKSSKEDNDEYQEILQLEEDDSSDDLEEEYVEMEDEEDYEDVSDTNSKKQDESDSFRESFDLYPINKRGRPPLSSKPSQRSDVYRYECVGCKRKYKNPTVYRKHMQSSHNVVIEHLPDFECPVCRKDCRNKSRLRLHMRQHLPDEKKLVVPCPYCDRKFSQVGAMRQHVNGIHHELKPYICDQCGRACKTLAALNEHQLVHTDECPFECDVCKKRFKNKARLKSHMDTHNESEYTCQDCGLKLNTRRTLLQHRLVHSNVKRFKCEFCDAAFKRSKSLKNHLLLHSGLRPYKCQFCDKSFSNGSNCRSHKRRVHPKELAEEEALGKKYEPVPIPKLEDLKAAKSAIVQPRKINRQSTGLPVRLRNYLRSAESSKQNPEDSDDNGMDSYDMQDIHYEIEGEIEDDELEEHHDADGCEETVIYEIIDEI